MLIDGANPLDAAQRKRLIIEASGKCPSSLVSFEYDLNDDVEKTIKTCVIHIMNLRNVTYTLILI